LVGEIVGVDVNPPKFVAEGETVAVEVGVKVGGVCVPVVVKVGVMV
jgi:hypothetical protein